MTLQKCDHNVMQGLLHNVNRPLYAFSYYIMLLVIVFAQKIENHSIAISQGEEPYCKQLSINMSKESADGVDPLVLVVHQSKWRSKCMPFHIDY